MGASLGMATQITLQIPPNQTKSAYKRIFLAWLEALEEKGIDLTKPVESEERSEWDGKDIG